MKKIKWRLSKLPTSEEVTLLLKEKVITQEEAREILFNFEDETDRDKKSLEEEIKFLRSLVEKLANGNYSTVHTYIYEYHTPKNQPWFQPYYTWCSSASAGSGQNYALYSATNTSAINTASTDQANMSVTYSSGTSFSDIKTF